MKNSIIVIAVALAGCINAPHAQDEAPATASAPHSHAKPAPVASSGSPTQGLSDLDAMTFDCPKAGLNAAAREAARVPSQGTYQFSYFRIINDAHHAAYEVHFKSNYTGEPELRYCVLIYCQQGWDPTKTHTQVTLISDERQGPAGHESTCGVRAGAAKKNRQR